MPGSSADTTTILSPGRVRFTRLSSPANAEPDEHPRHNDSSRASMAAAANASWSVT